jgi:hypothetical protein
MNEIKKHPVNDEESYQTYVFKQPETLEEEKLCKEVVLYCPVEAVHDDGK